MTLVMEGQNGKVNRKHLFSHETRLHRKQVEGWREVLWLGSPMDKHG